VITPRLGAVGIDTPQLGTKVMLLGRDGDSRIAGDARALTQNGKKGEHIRKKHRGARKTWRCRSIGVWWEQAELELFRVEALNRTDRNSLETP